MIHAFHGLPRPLRIRRARQHGPTLRDGVDLAFVVRSRAERGAVVEIRAPVPVAVPALQFDVLLQFRRMVRAVAGEFGIAPAPGKLRKMFQHVIQEERKPHALALVLRADEIHPVVPVAAADERQPMHAESEPVFDRPHAVLVERAVFPRALRQIVVGFLVGIHRTAFEERRALIEHAGVAGRLHIPAGRVGQPEKIVGAMRAHAAATGRMPPVLHVAFAELAAGRPQQMFTRGPRRGVEQRGRVLELVAEPVRAARLVIATPAPIATGQRLILQPAVD